MPVVLNNKTYGITLYSKNDNAFALAEMFCTMYQLPVENIAVLEKFIAEFMLSSNLPVDFSRPVDPLLDKMYAFREVPFNHFDGLDRYDMFISP